MTRFQPCFNSLDAALHSFFKLLWLTWLEENEFGFHLEIAKKRIITKSISLIDESQSSLNLSNSSSSNSSLHSTNNNEVEFFEALYLTFRSDRVCDKDIVIKFLKTLLEKVLLHSKLFPLKSLKDIFTKYNTVLSSSAAAKRLCFLNKDALKQKRSGLTDQHFEMLFFLKDVRICVFFFCLVLLFSSPFRNVLQG